MTAAHQQQQQQQQEEEVVVVLLVHANVYDLCQEEGVILLQLLVLVLVL